MFLQKLKATYAIRIDTGYDFSDNITLYGFGRFSRVGYEVNWKSINSKGKGKGKEVSPIFGTGIFFYPNKNISLNFEYNFQNLDIDTPNLGANTINTAQTDIINTLKIGFGYQF